MADQRMQIIAEMIDKVTPAAKRMQKSFEDLQKASAREFPQAFKKYQNAVLGNERALGQFSKRSEGMRREIKAFQDVVARTSPKVFELTKSLGSFTLGTGAAVGAIAAVGVALIEAGKYAAEFAKSMKEIKFGSAETGLGKLQLQQIILALDEFNIGQEQTIGSFKGLRAAMTQAQTETGKFLESIAPFGEDALILARPIVALIKAGKSTAEVYKAIAATVDKIKEDHPGATGEDLARRFVKMFGMSDDLGRVGLKALQEKLEVVEKLGATGDEMKDAALQAELLNRKLFEGSVIIDKWLTLVGTDITKVFLYINNLLDEIDGWWNKHAPNLKKLFDAGPMGGGGPASSIGPVPGFPGGDTFKERFDALPKFAEGGTVTGPTKALVGEAGPEYVMPHLLGRSRRYDKPTVTTLGQQGPETVIPARGRAYINAIGRTETGFNTREAYSEKLNQASNNTTVAAELRAGRSGFRGGDYGFFQNNRMQVDDAIARGMAPHVAQHLVGGMPERSAAAALGGSTTPNISTREQQTSAMHEYLGKTYPEKYGALTGGGAFEEMRKATQNRWFGLKDNAGDATKEFNASLESRANLNAAMGGGINSTGQLDVSVRAPQGTSVKAEGGGIFQKTDVRRHIQMPTAPGGPPQATDVPYMQRQ